MVAQLPRRTRASFPAEGDRHPRDLRYAPLGFRRNGFDRSNATVEVMCLGNEPRVSCDIATARSASPELMISPVRRPAFGDDPG
jgi:hypothetical protein